jgi:hypothetical protein
MGRSRDRPFGEEQRQGSISGRGDNFHAGEVTARVGFNGPNKARLKCGPLDPGIAAGFINPPSLASHHHQRQWRLASLAAGGKPPTTR